MRLALSPDEVNTDLALILNGIDSARANGPPRPPVSRPTDTGARSVEKIHSSRGILHYHDITYEKGDRASVFTHARPGVGKIGLPYSGTILSVNAKEIQIKTDDGTFCFAQGFSLSDRPWHARLVVLTAVTSPMLFFHGRHLSSCQCWSPSKRAVHSQAGKCNQGCCFIDNGTSLYGVVKF